MKKYKCPYCNKRVFTYLDKSRVGSTLEIYFNKQTKCPNCQGIVGDYWYIKVPIVIVAICIGLNFGGSDRFDVTIMLIFVLVLLLEHFIPLRKKN